MARAYADILASRVLPDLGPLRLSAVTRDDVEAWVAAAERATRSDGEFYAKSTLSDWWLMLRMLLRDAHAEGLCSADPTLRVRGPRPRVHVELRREQRTLTGDELGRLLDAARQFLSSDRHAEIATLALTGIRAGEGYALRWDDIDFEGRAIHVRRSAVRGHEGPTKTGAARVAPLPDVLADVLRDWRRRQIADQHPACKTGLVFATAAGLPRDAGSLHKPLDLVASHAGIEQRVTAQVLRRTFNTLALLAGVDRLVLRASMGHTSEGMTERYAGISLAAKQEAAGKVVDLVTRANPKGGPQRGTLPRKGGG